MSFAQLLKQLRTRARLTQEELARAARLSPRSVSDLERGVNLTARKETARLLADALNLAGPARAGFEAAARGFAADEFPASTMEAGSIAAATRTLPRDIVLFTGRESELRQVVGAVEDAIGSGGVVGIHAINGMAGIGKTAFAVHAAHQLAPQFPEGQLFLSLHGHTPGHRPVDPADALASLLLTTGVAAQQIPPGLEARMRLWRDHLADRQLLLVLDDAAGHEQVRPLLPGTAGILVLVTSRRHLTALEDAQSISLDILPADDAAELLIRLAARPGIAAGDAAVGEITRLCGYLPLAVGMLARQLHHHPAWTAAELASDLAAARDRLALMHAENLSVATAFDLSYQDLTGDQQRVFRRLGLHPGTDIDAYAAAALNDIDLAAARRHLDALYDQHLLTEPGRGRYRLHDLIREHARTLAATDPASDCDAAFGRLVDYYLHTARAADRHLARRTPAETPAVTGTPPACAPDLPAREDAVAWMDAERLNLHAAANYAATHDRPGHATAIPAAMHSFLRSQGHWDQALTLHRAALDLAHHVGEQLAEACALTDLGTVQQVAGDYPAAAAALSQALDLYRGLGDRLGEASALNRLGVVQYLTGNYPEAAVSLALALELYCGLCNTLGEANALTDLSVVQGMTGDHRAAAAGLSHALELHRGLGNQLGEASALTDLGVVQRVIGECQAAVAGLSRALELYRDLGDRLGEANALNILGVVQRVIGDYPSAAAGLGRSLDLCRGLGYRIGEANALNNLGVVQRLTGDYRAAVVSLNRSLELCLSLGYRLGEASALKNLGGVQSLTGDDPAAAVSLARALELHRGLGHRLGEAETLNTMGEQSLASAAPTKAPAHHQQALAIAVGIVSPLEEARALEGIGRFRLRDGQPGQAAALLREARAIYQRIGSPKARQVERTLRDYGL